MTLSGKSHDNRLWLLIVFALIAYSLPWVMNPSVSLSLGGYDLAEWSSLHPEVRANSSLLTSLLLRVQPVLLALIVAIRAHYPFRSAEWWLRAAFVLIVVIALLPPLEFFSAAGNDINYRQQFILAVITLLGGAIGLSGFLYRYQRPIIIGLALLGIATSAVGLQQSSGLMLKLKLPVQTGLGGVILILLYATVVLNYFREVMENKQGSAKL
jgi:hypothetical protein